MVDFWPPLGPWGPPKTSPERPRILPFFHRFSVGSENRPGLAPRRPQGAPGGAPRHLPGTILDGFSIDFSGQFPHALFRNCFPLVPRCEMRHFRKSCGIFSEVARKLPVIAMQYAFSCWISLRVQAMVGKACKTLVISGATMHERFSYSAICTVEL